MRPRSFWHGSMATSGLGSEGTVLTSVLVPIRSPPSSSAWSAVAPIRRVLKRISTPRFMQDLLREAGQALGQLGQDEVPRMEEDDPDLGGIDAAKVPRHPAHEIVQLRHGLDAGKATPRHDEGQQVPAHVGIGLDVGLAQGVDHVVAHGEGVAQVLEGQGVLGQARGSAEARHVAQGHDQMVVLQYRPGRSRALRQS